MLCWLHRTFRWRSKGTAWNRKIKEKITLRSQTRNMFMVKRNLTQYFWRNNVSAISKRSTWVNMLLCIYHKLQAKSAQLCCCYDKCSVLQSGLCFLFLTTEITQAYYLVQLLSQTAVTETTSPQWISLPIFLCLTLHNVLMGIVLTEIRFYKWKPVLNRCHTETVKVIF